MAKSVLDIAINIVKAGNGDVEAVKSLQAIKSTVGNVTTVFGTLAAAGVAVNTVYQNTVKVFIDYASKIRDMSRMTGMGAEETSKLVQAADDLDISFESLQKSLWNASKKGIDVSVESLAAMADEFTAIQSPAQQAIYLSEKFGKSGADMGKLLKLGGDGVKKYTESIEGNLVLTEEQIQQSEQARLALDALADAWEGVKVAAGSYIGAIIASTAATRDMTAEAERFGIIHDGMNDRMKNSAFDAFRGQMERGAAMTAYYNEQLGKTSTAVDETGMSLEELSAQNEKTIKNAIALQAETDKYNQSQSDILAKIKELEAKKASMYPWEKTAIADVNNKIAGLKDEYAASAAAFEEAQGRKLAMLALEKIAVSDGVAGYSDAEMAKAEALLNTAGIAEDSALRQTLAFEKASTMIANATNTAEAYQRVLEAMEKGYNINIVSNWINTGVAPTTTAGGANAALGPHVGPNAGRAQGGPLAKGWTLVGEEGQELISPSGWVFPADETRVLLGNGFLPEFQRGGGGPLTNPGSKTPIVTQSGSLNTGSSSQDDSGSSSSVFTPSGSTVSNQINTAAAIIESQAVIEPLAAQTAAAVTASQNMAQVAQNQTVMMVNTLTQNQQNVVNSINETNRLLRQNQVTLPNLLAAAVQQAIPG